MEVSNPDELVRNIREQYLTDSPDLVRTSLHGHSNVVQMNFASTYFPLEFIQNADDEGASAVRFQIRKIDGDWCLEILNNGREFTDGALKSQDRDADDVKDDVTGLCAAGVSPKHPRNHIGFIGVGSNQSSRLVNASRFTPVNSTSRSIENVRRSTVMRFLGESSPGVVSLRRRQRFPRRLTEPSILPGLSSG